MTNEFMVALALLADSPEMQEPATLASRLLAVYPPKGDESSAATLCRFQAEMDEMLEGLIGSVWAGEDLT